MEVILSFVIEFNQEIKNFLNIRNTNIKLNKTVEGLKIPKQAIVNRKGEKGALKIKDEDMTFVSFDIIAESKDEDFVIIDRETTSLRKMIL